MSNSNKEKKAVEVPGWEYYDAQFARPMWFPVNFILSYFK